MLLNKFQKGNHKGRPIIKIAAIDNGLSFPQQHFGYFRKYCYKWASCPQADQPFSDQTAKQLLPLLDGKCGFNGYAIENLVKQLLKIFKKDTSFTEDIFNQQMQVLRG